jgi:hypothetical protein
MAQDEGDVILEELFGQAVGSDDQDARVFPTPPAANDVDEAPKRSKPDNETHTQWALGGNGRFSPVGRTVPNLPSGVYEPFALPGTWGLESITIASDGIYLLPDMATDMVLKEVQTFWTSEAKYRQHNLLYKRGIIMWGPPGGGKSVAVKLLMNELVKRNGVVIIGNNVNLTLLCLRAVRRIEPERNIIVVMEDIDEILHQNGEAGVLSMLDGESNIDNVLHLATTNHPEKLGARIINRPSRFDRRVFVGMPAPAAREAYLIKATGGGLSPTDLAKWVADTDKMSIAHLRELVAAVYCLDQPYDDVIDRLKGMSVPVKGDEGFAHSRMGFKASGPAFSPIPSRG